MTGSTGGRPKQTADLVDHFFRHEYGRLVSSLVGKFGLSCVEQIEDGVQSAMEAALISWAQKGIPDNPAAWLQRVSQNRVLDQFRRAGISSKHDEKAYDQRESHPESHHLGSEIVDDQLRMLFICCDEQLPVRTQLILALKILCGFSVHEIALRMLTNPEAVGKRLRRGRKQLRDLEPILDSPRHSVLERRVPAVHKVLYLLFTEGYSSSIADQPIKREICEEAIRLTQLLVQHPRVENPQSWALLALMHFHHARITSRSDGTGSLVLLEEQDRSHWNRDEIEAGLRCLARSARGETFSHYHAEAGVLAEHCLAPSYAETSWEKIVELYQMLEERSPSPLHTLNRAIALAEWKGPEAGLLVLKQLKPPTWLLSYYLWDATLGELYRRAGDAQKGKLHLERALTGAPTEAERERLRKRISLCDPVSL